MEQSILLAHPGDAIRYESHVNQDLGLDSQQLKAYADAYEQYMTVVYKAVLDRKKFSWQQVSQRFFYKGQTTFLKCTVKLWTGQEGSLRASTCPEPLVKNATCKMAL